MPTSAVAELIVGGRALGIQWWSQSHEGWNVGGGWTDRGTRDALLAAGHDRMARQEDGGSCLALLGQWVSDDAADAQWGRPIDFVDLNDPRGDDRVVLPDGVAPGDRVVAAFDPGARVWVDIVQRHGAPDSDAEEKGFRRGSVGSRLGETVLHDAAEAGWAWSMATDTGPILLPGESADDPSDPFLAPIDPDVSRELFAWAADHGATADALGESWRTKRDIWSARFRLGLPYDRPGTWFIFERAVTAVVDGDSLGLAAALEALDRP